jgi:hypothetical protein
VIVPQVPVVDTTFGDIAAIVGGSLAPLAGGGAGVSEGVDGEVAPPQAASASAASAATIPARVIEAPFLRSGRQR